MDLIAQLEAEQIAAAGQHFLVQLFGEIRQADAVAALHLHARLAGGGNWPMIGNPSDRTH